MPKVTYIEHNGTEHQVEVPVGLSVMRGAVNNNVPGIDADCGDECACATCHVYVDPAWLEEIGLPETGSMEDSTLSFAAAAAFGFGIHRCVGNRLAELQLRILWEELLPRHPVIEVLAPPRRTYSNFIHGMRSMPVRIPA